VTYEVSEGSEDSEGNVEVDGWVESDGNIDVKAFAGYVGGFRRRRWGSCGVTAILGMMLSVVVVVSRVPRN